jgi:hypothetical protein
MCRLRRHELATLALGMALLTGCSSSVGSLPVNAPNRAPSAYDITVKYVVTFYPLWFTYQQWRVSSVNQFIGPSHMGPLYHAVVAPNDDTLYANTVVNVTKEPVIFTIPATKDHYSVLSTDAFGNVNDTGIATAGTYGLTGPHWQGTLPPGVTPVSLPANMTSVIVRADKYAPDGQNEELEAERFRRELRASPLSDYERDPHARPTNILPLFYFSVPFKGIADDVITKDPVGFLGQLQKAVASTIPPPLTSQEQAISAQFDALFSASNRNDSGFMQGARDAHQMILNRYLQNTGKTNWITFADIGTTWSSLVRSAITEFIQYGNSHATAAYYQAFKDGEGDDLDAKTHNYVVTFSKSQIPQAQRFWSVTAYIPGSITLFRNSARKYLVGSYTPGLRKNRDGSISIYLAQRLPNGVPMANWLPVPSGQFNLMLRVYGPEGKVAANTYVPPAVEKLQSRRNR